MLITSWVMKESFSVFTGLAMLVESSITALWFLAAKHEVNKNNK